MRDYDLPDFDVLDGRNGPFGHGYCECGCGKTTPPARITSKAKGWIKGQPKRFVNGHNGRRQGGYTATQDKKGCRNWLGKIDQWGYGRIMVRRRVGRGYVTRMAHRVVYEQRRGEIPEHMQIDHLCKNRACVNPDHLEAVSLQENVRRSRVAKLTASKVDRIRKLIALGATNERLGHVGGGPDGFN